MKKLLGLMFWLTILGLVACYALKIEPLFSLTNASIGYVQGQVALESGKPKEALTHFKQVLDINPPFAEEVMADIGYCYSRLQMPQQALDYYLLATERNPKHYVSLQSTARLLWQMGWRDDAKDIYKRTIGLYPGNQPLIVEYADKLFWLAKQTDNKMLLQEAADQYHEGLPLPATEDKIGAWLRQAETNYRLGRYQTAMQNYCQVLSLEKAPAEAMYSFGITLDKLHQPKMAKHYIHLAAEELSSVNPDLARSWQVTSLAYTTKQLEEGQTDLFPEGKACLGDLAKMPRYQ